jgi:hypothetical protein
LVRVDSSTKMCIVNPEARLIIGISVGLGGSLYPILFGTGTVLGCLGPLYVTAVRCAHQTGARPTEGPGLALAAGAIALGIVIATGRSRATRHDALIALAGALLGAGAYFARRPTALEGFDYDGSWLSIPLPVEPLALVSWAIAGSLVGLAAVSVARAVREAGLGRTER